jgi:hypothetical protein
MNHRRTRRTELRACCRWASMLDEAIAHGTRAYIEAFTETYARLNAEAHAHEASPPLNVACYSGILSERIRSAVKDCESLDEVESRAELIATEMRRDPLQVTASASLAEMLYMLAALRGEPSENFPERDLFKKTAARLAEAISTGERISDAAARLMRDDDELYAKVMHHILGLVPEREIAALPYRTLLRISRIPEPLLRVGLDLHLGAGAIRTCPGTRFAEIEKNSFWRTERDGSPQCQPAANQGRSDGSEDKSEA